jgi:hypothetical protein
MQFLPEPSHCAVAHVGDELSITPQPPVVIALSTAAASRVP